MITMKICRTIIIKTPLDVVCWFRGEKKNRICHVFVTDVTLSNDQLKTVLICRSRAHREEGCSVTDHGQEGTPPGPGA